MKTETCFLEQESICYLSFIKPTTFKHWVVKEYIFARIKLLVLIKLEAYTLIHFIWFVYILRDWVSMIINKPHLIKLGEFCLVIQQLDSLIFKSIDFRLKFFDYSLLGTQLLLYFIIVLSVLVFLKFISFSFLPVLSNLLNLPFSPR